VTREEAVARTLDDVGETLKTIVDLLESDSAHLKDTGIREELVGFPWDARDRAITEVMMAVEGLRNRIRLIRAG
jgi:hypothetical protein